jgi:hypothetical protein
MKIMNDATEQKAGARRTILMLYGLMAAGILAPLAIGWLKR